MDDYGSEAYLPMVSDWDLSAAFLSASDPGKNLGICLKSKTKTIVLETFTSDLSICVFCADLQLVVEKKNIPLDVDDGSGDYEEDQWDMIKTGEVMPPGGGGSLTDSQDTKSQYSQKTEYNTSGFSSQSSLSMISRVSSAYTNQQYPISFNTKINTAGLFTAVRELTIVLTNKEKLFSHCTIFLIFLDGEIGAKSEKFVR